mmetsp:Transcript_29418/g.73874  ORF Transcript_29418/g.73874 Transcript_29418/m.73874 type:complete len:150 (+) Transcript_29418:99-548(+)
MTAWLLGDPKYHMAYKCGVLWNPASSLHGLFASSDIPEWVLAESGRLDDSHLDAEKSRAADDAIWAASPMSVVSNVSAPALVVLGLADARVPPAGGLRWAQAASRARKARGEKEVDVISFEGQGHGITGPGCYEDAIASIAMWIEKTTI